MTSLTSRLITSSFWAICFVCAFVGLMQVITSPLLSGAADAIGTNYLIAWLLMLGGPTGALLALSKLYFLETADVLAEARKRRLLSDSLALLTTLLSFVYIGIPVYRVAFGETGGVLLISNPAGLFNAITFIPLLAVGFIIGIVVLSMVFQMNLKTHDPRVVAAVGLDVR